MLFSASCEDRNEAKKREEVGRDTICGDTIRYNMGDVDPIM